MRIAITPHKLLPEGLYFESLEHRDRAREHLRGL